MVKKKEEKRQLYCWDTNRKTKVNGTDELVTLITELKGGFKTKPC
jgi:hypothetical protein